MRAVSSRSALRSLMPTVLRDSGNGVLAVRDGGEDLELDRGHQGGALPIGLRHLLQPRGVQSLLLLLRHALPPVAGS